MPYICLACREGEHDACGGSRCACPEDHRIKAHAREQFLAALERTGASPEVIAATKAAPLHPPKPKKKPKARGVKGTRPSFLVQDEVVVVPEEVVISAGRPEEVPNDRLEEEPLVLESPPEPPPTSGTPSQGSREPLEGAKANDRSASRKFEIDDETRRLRQEGMANRRLGRELTLEQKQAVRRYQRARWAQLSPEQRKVEVDRSNASRSHRRKAESRALVDLREMFPTEYQAFVDMHLARLMAERELATDG